MESSIKTAVTDTRERLENRGVTGTGSLCTPAPKRSAAGRTGAPLRSTDERKAASLQTENQFSRLRRRQNQSAMAAEATSWEKTVFPMKYMNTPKYGEPMPPYLGVFRIGSKKWQPHEFLAKFLAFADFWRRLKFARLFLQNGEFSPHLRFGGASAAPLPFLPAAHPRKVRRYILFTYSEYIISVQF